MEQTEDEKNLATYFSTDNALQGGFQMPSTLTFKPLSVPPNVPVHFGLLFEDLRDAILDGASLDVSVLVPFLLSPSYICSTSMK